MLKAFKYRLYPSQQQVNLFNSWLEECRWLYNHFLEERRDALELAEHILNYHAQAVSLPGLKQERPSLREIHSQVLQNVAVRVDLAFKAFFRRVKAGERPGYPRFKGRGWYDSFTLPQSSWSIGDGSVTLSKIGSIKTKLHRPLTGTAKTCTVKRSSTGKWFVSFACENIPADVIPASEEIVGIDVGLINFAGLSTGEAIGPPKFYRQEEKALACAQRRLSKEAKGAPARTKRRKVVARVHERIANRRHDFAHQESRKIVNRFQVIAVEDLAVNRMVHNHCLAKSIMDAAWAQFATYLSFKAESAGRSFVAVNPAYTTQDCSQCGHRQAMRLGERVYSFPCCHLELDRDHNASLNIRALGLQSLGLSREAPAFMRGE